jgi:penicillin-binding protein 1B
VSLIITTRASKDDILEMYLNDMPLGQRGSFAIVGVAEASRLFFGKDVSNVTLAEAATIAGVLQSPSALSPFNNPARARSAATSCCRRWSTPATSTRTPPIARTRAAAVVQRALEAEAPYFVDFVGRRSPTVSRADDDDRPGGGRLHDARSAPAALAQDAVRDGLDQVDSCCRAQARARPKRR